MRFYNMPAGNWFACNVDGVTFTNPLAGRVYPPRFNSWWSDWNSPEDSIYDGWA